MVTDPRQGCAALKAVQCVNCLPGTKWYLEIVQSNEPKLFVIDMSKPMKSTDSYWMHTVTDAYGRGQYSKGGLLGCKIVKL